MNPTEGGRVCQQCNKLVVDFTKHRWQEIEKVQQQHNFSVCGMYRPQQLVHWGREVPRANPAKALVAASFVASLAVPSLSLGQSPDSTPRYIVHGKITTRNQQGAHEALPGANVLLQGTTAGVVTDAQGTYSLDITEYADTLERPTLVFSFIGYYPVTVALSNQQSPPLRLDADLTVDTTSDITYFYVEKPSRWKRIMGWLRHPFVRQAR